MIENTLRELLAFAKNTDLYEIEWEKGGAKIAFRRAEVRGAATAPAAAAEDSTEAAPEAPKTLYIRSTMVGTFFRADSADRPPLVVEGTIVMNGQPVASVEAMKIRKDVMAPMDCRILKSLVADGHSVEYGQPLFEVELTNGENGHV